jgi:hypothetical protein
MAAFWAPKALCRRGGKVGTFLVTTHFIFEGVCCHTDSISHDKRKVMIAIGICSDCLFQYFQQAATAKVAQN